MGVVICFYDDRGKNKMAAKTEDLRETFNEIEARHNFIAFICSPISIEWAGCAQPYSCVVCGRRKARKKTRREDSTTCDTHFLSLSLTLGGREDYLGKEVGCRMEMPTSWWSVGNNDSFNKNHFPGTSTIEQIIKEDSSELANEVRDFREKEKEWALLLI